MADDDKFENEKYLGVWTSVAAPHLCFRLCMCYVWSNHESAWNDKVSDRGVKMWPVGYWDR